MKKFGKTEQTLLEKWKNKGLNVSKLETLDLDKLSPEQIEHEFQAFSQAVTSKSEGITKTLSYSSCAYLDIETTGFSHSTADITVLGIYLEKRDGGKLIQLVGSSINSVRLHEIFKNVDLLYTYYGTKFDLPFIRGKLGLDLTRYCEHKDLMDVCHNLNIYGGLKETERKLGIHRTIDLRGREAVALWSKYKYEGNKEALTTLLKYNEEDVVNLSQIKQKLDAMRLGSFGGIISNYPEPSKVFPEPLGEHQKVIESSKQTTSINPDNALVHFNLGFTYLKSGDYQKAIEAFKEAVRIRPDFAEAHYDLGQTYKKMWDNNHNQKAIEAYKEAVRIKPDYTEAHYNLGEIYWLLGNCQKAIEAYKEVIHLRPNSALAHFKLGVAYGDSRDTQKAIEVYKQVIRLKPDDDLALMAYFNLGFACLQSDNYQKAIESFKEVIRKNPDDALVYNGLGRSYLKSGDMQKAIESFKEVIRIKPDDAEAHYILGLAYIGAQDYQKSIDSGKQAIRILRSWLKRPKIIWDCLSSGKSKKRISKPR